MPQERRLFHPAVYRAAIFFLLFCCTSAPAVAFPRHSATIAWAVGGRRSRPVWRSRNDPDIDPGDLDAHFFDAMFPESPGGTVVEAGLLVQPGRLLDLFRKRVYGHLKPRNGAVYRRYSLFRRASEFI
jgi:hypothetical protein